MIKIGSLWNESFFIFSQQKMLVFLTCNYLLVHFKQLNIHFLLDFSYNHNLATRFWNDFCISLPSTMMLEALLEIFIVLHHIISLLFACGYHQFLFPVDLPKGIGSYCSRSIFLLNNYHCRPSNRLLDFLASLALFLKYEIVKFCWEKVVSKKFP